MKQSNVSFFCSYTQQIVLDLCVLLWYDKVKRKKGASI